MLSDECVGAGLGVAGNRVLVSLASPFYEFWIIYIGDLFHTNMYNFHTNDLEWKTIKCKLVCQVYLTKQTGWKFKTQPKKLTNV